MSSALFNPKRPLVNLQRLDRLIDNYLCGLIERTEDVKLVDFCRLVDLRHRIEPVDKTDTTPVSQINAARESQLPNSGASTVEHKGEAE